MVRELRQGKVNIYILKVTARIYLTTICIAKIRDSRITVLRCLGRSLKNCELCSG